MKLLLAAIILMSVAPFALAQTGGKLETALMLKIVPLTVRDSSNVAA